MFETVTISLCDSSLLVHCSTMGAFASLSIVPSPFFSISTFIILQLQSGRRGAQKNWKWRRKVSFFFLFSYFFLNPTLHKCLTRATCCMMEVILSPLAAQSTGWMMVLRIAAMAALYYPLSIGLTFYQKWFIKVSLFLNVYLI